MEKTLDVTYKNYRLRTTEEGSIRQLRVTPVDRTKPFVDIYGEGSSFDYESYFVLGTSSPGTLTEKEMRKYLNTYEEALKAVEFFKQELLKNGFENIK
nr:hypothetical protein CoNPh38_CDS0354 [Staphylococcus phage S-CoN_Ph38]